jgi:dihydroorotase
MTPGAINKIFSKVFEIAIIAGSHYETEHDAFEHLMTLFMNESKTDNRKTIILASRQAKILANKLYHKKYI